MIAQIIFFTSLTIFILIIIRKVRRTPYTYQSIPSRSPEEQVIKRKPLPRRFDLSALFRRRQTAVKPSGLINPTPSVIDNPVVGPRPSTDFWKDEQVQDKPLVTSDLEEAQKYIKAGRYSEAERLLLNAASLNPKDGRIFAKLGLIYLYQKNYNDAIESLKVAVKLDKYNPSRHYNLALAYWGIKDNQRAIASIREAISLDPVTEKYRQFLEKLLENK